MKTPNSSSMRCERDVISELNVPANAYYGIHTLRAAQNFPFSGQRLHPAFIRAYAHPKRACALTSADIGFLSEKRGDAIATACMEVESGKLHDQIIINPFHGGANTWTNMNFNEVIANRANEIMGENHDKDAMMHPIHHVTMHHSTNDTCPTALKKAVLNFLEELEDDVSKYQNLLQRKKIEFREVKST
ncbi:lyase family protein [uncultured Pseudodesulfovibrio sp.]|uniref:lyase family protein n=1 Tax=uncultured Pseudodesulfovibrio sp. TaxID=2035858 RepID=UPI0029C98FB6|nr:lyase family protein [uncultured Pseudodesulfovibrio sp.]